jgi:uncharacterized protein YjiS (DUF1127 family)
LKASPFGANFSPQTIAIMHQGESVMYGQICDKATIETRRNRDRRPILATLFDRLLVWQDRVRGRRMLRELDERMLHDIGIDRGVAEREASTPFWR